MLAAVAKKALDEGLRSKCFIHFAHITTQTSTAALPPKWWLRHSGLLCLQVFASMALYGGFQVVCSGGTTFHQAEGVGNGGWSWVREDPWKKAYWLTAVFLLDNRLSLKGYDHTGYTDGHDWVGNWLACTQPPLRVLCIVSEQGWWWPASKERPKRVSWRLWGPDTK